MVPGTGLEPAHLTATASKTVVSAIPPPGRVRNQTEFAANRVTQASGEFSAPLCGG